LGNLAEHTSAQIPRLEVEYVENVDRRNYRVNFDKIWARLNFTCEKTLADGIGEIKLALERGQVKNYREAVYHNDRSLVELNGYGPHAQHTSCLRPRRSS
jgi:hypothetical protein